MSGSERNFENTFQDYDGRTSLQSPDGKIVEPFLSRLKDETYKLLKQCEEGFQYTRDDRDYSVYTGSGGMAFLYMHLSETLFKDNEDQRQKYLKNARRNLEHDQHGLRGRRMTFVCGDPGILSSLAVLYSKLGQEDKSTKCLSKLLSLSDNVCGGDPSLPDEVLYGRAGYLFSLLFVQKHLGEEKIPHDIINQVCQVILDSGERLSRRERSNSPLMFMWHEKHYVGAAHGIVGIMFMLLQALSAQSVQSHLRSVESCVEFLLSKQFPSGNFPSSLESGTDKLIHWCHGAPGAVHLMIKAYQVFGKEKYLDAALKCGEVVWSRGLLKKGYGICHGVAGNAYTFLCLFKQTGDQKYLHRAIKFAEWCFDYGQHGCRTPDHPYSLFEGMAGTVYFLADLLEPKSSKFPAFEI
ncbi:lanC-like protein 2 [Porites lutea]|uniref:lanC-like protein 2 n=1 Tax=Porites lutea TaxID=51062 RepID=UPI003CC55940